MNYLEETIRKVLGGEASTCCMDDEDDVNRTTNALLRALKYLEDNTKSMHYLSENACKSCFQQYFNWCEANEHGWIYECEVCGKDFDTKEEADSHEEKCQESKLPSENEE